jgi:hypothetical protein
MRRTFSERRRFPVLMRWLYAGSDLSRSKRVDQHTVRSLRRSEGPPSSLVHAPGLAYLRIPKSRRASVAPTIEASANIKSP